MKYFQNNSDSSSSSQPNSPDSKPQLLDEHPIQIDEDFIELPSALPKPLSPPPKSPKKSIVQNWESKYLGEFMTTAWSVVTSFGSKKKSKDSSSLAEGDEVILEREEAVEHKFKGFNNSKIKKSSKEDDKIVKFKNKKGVEVGRIGKKDSEW
jgi:hypothetical protein